MDMKKVPHSDPLILNLYFRNKGAAPADDFIYSYADGASDKLLTQKQIDDTFSKMKKDLKKSESIKMDTQIQQGNGIFFSVDTSMSRADFNKTKDESKPLYLYLMVLAEYRDSETPTGVWRRTEVCTYTRKDDGFHVCNSHNKIFLAP